MRYADIHTHILFGVDDGPSDIEEMRKLIELSYEDGARILCATPHMRPEFWGDPSEAVRRAFAEASSYVQQTFPDMQLFLGSEIRYHQNCLQWIQEGRCSSINGGRYILLEFSDQVIPEQITDACRRVLQKVIYR
ncbi:MAG: hypothetical protein Q4B09_10915 [Lachnospiraceae bacterium]|nr:hypothetical protein [Lachnospiraceae bacterium]